jgi:hypothetical protein
VTVLCVQAVSPSGDDAGLVNLTEGVPQLLCFPATQSEAVAIGKLESALRRRLVAADVRPSTSSASREDGSRVAEVLEGEDQEEEPMLKVGTLFPPLDPLTSPASWRELYYVNVWLVVSFWHWSVAWRSSNHTRLS